MDVKKLAENLGLEEDEYLELVRLLIQTSRADMSGVESAITDRDSDRAAQRFHSIKGAAGNLGLMEIYELAKNGEHMARDNALNQLNDVIQEMKTRLDSLAATAGS